MGKFKNFLCEIDIVDMEFPNIGIGFFEDKKIKIKNTIFGQKVSTIVLKKRKGYVGAKSMVVQKAIYEINPKCENFLDCGGCTYQNITYEKELEIKEKLVLDLFEKDNIKFSSYLGINPSPILEGYRNKMEYSFGDSEKGGILALGMRRVNSFYEVVTSKKCNIVDEDYRKILTKTLEFFENTDEKFYHKGSHEGTLRHLLVRKGTFSKEIILGIVTTSTYSFDENNYAKMLQEIPFDGVLKGVYHIINDGVSDVVKADMFKVLYGDEFFYENILGLKFKISPFSFFQTNSAGAEELYKIVADFIGNVQDKVVYDLYSGTGTIGQVLAKSAKKVIGIEIVEEAVLAANENAKLNGLENATFLAGDVFECLDNILEMPDTIVLDPPRDGVSAKSLEKILTYGVKNIVYVSCKATSLVRDMKIFNENGYVGEKLKIQDMFPRTSSVECVVLLTKSV